MTAQDNQLAKTKNEILDVTSPELDQNLAKDYQMDEVNNILVACSPLQLKKRTAFEQTAILGSGMARLRQIFDASPMQAAIMSLQGTQLGFTTDRDKPKDNQEKGYRWDVVRDCMIEAALKGLRPIDNEITIISARMYAGKTGVKRLVREFPGLTNLVPSYGVPVLIQTAKGVGCMVKCSATWMLNGSPNSIQCDIPIKGDDWSTVDQYLGKAERKLHARIYNILNGSETIDESDAESEQPYRAVDGRLVPNVANRMEAVERAREAVKDEPTQVIDKPLSPQNGPKGGRPRPAAEGQPAQPLTGSATPPDEASHMAEAESFIAPMDAAQVREFIGTIPPEILKVAMVRAETNLDDQASAKEVRGCAVIAKALMLSQPKGPREPTKTPEEERDAAIAIEVDAFIKREKPKSKGLEKACQKVLPQFLEQAKKDVGFTDSVSGRKDEEIEPLLRRAKLLELQSKK